jgi:hypothetical protein
VKKYLVLLLFISTTYFAQYPLRNGETQLNFGFGFSSWGLPVYGGLDFGVHKDVSVGGEISYRSYDDDWAGAKYNHSILGISGNVNYHFNHLMRIGTDWDIYAGLNLGFYSWNSPNGYEGSHTSGLGLGAQIGARYYFSHKWAVNLEFGGGNAFSNGKIGATVKL